jgi:hypothetical protein
MKGKVIATRTAPLMPAGRVETRVSFMIVVDRASWRARSTTIMKTSHGTGRRMPETALIPRVVHISGDEMANSSPGYPQPSECPPRPAPRHGSLGRMATDLPDSCRQLIELQCGVLARWQAPAVGLGTSTIRSLLQGDRWQQMYLGVYATHTGDPSRDAQLWAAVLRRQGNCRYWPVLYLPFTLPLPWHLVRPSVGPRYACSKTGSPPGRQAGFPATHRVCRAASAVALR